MTTAAINFRFNETNHEYTVGGVRVPSVTQILESAGLVDYRGIPAETLRYAADRGTAVHLASVYYDEEDLDPDSLDFEVAKYLAAWRRFRQEHNFQIIESEQRHLGELHGLQFGMTVDRVVKIDGRLAILDLKCSSKVYGWCGVQTAGYAIGLGNGTVAARLATYRRLVVQLKPDCTYRLHEYSGSMDGEIFAAALKIAHWKIDSNRG